MRDDRFREQPHARAQGDVGEDDAVEWLRLQGYRIVDRNVTSHAGELDAVARDGDTLCFVEIKARVSSPFGGALAAVDGDKRRRLARAARAYLARTPWDGPCRFDVLAIDLADEAAEPRFTLLQDAFQVED
jgi:putative endonuclease